MMAESVGIYFNTTQFRIQHFFFLKAAYFAHTTHMLFIKLIYIFFNVHQNREHVCVNGSIEDIEICGIEYIMRMARVPG